MGNVSSGIRKEDFDSTGMIIEVARQVVNLSMQDTPEIIQTSMLSHFFSSVLSNGKGWELQQERVMKGKYINIGDLCVQFNLYSLLPSVYMLTTQ